ncbi:MarR family winged helix-turn-helix transcriptional regulator [Nocardia puris]|uniref:DNA-binding MarR family transcriptional regulator n=1 Tax=Nocardia puris TaxID=208602 RepID=A0A366D957_9NOCA|nr:MarR family winged helix-turn-helix transcriptional regulator [Nocardia puris]RBO86573.1 DNA-binding MarR family transcriptional regulator [Nocardia puris]
MSIEDSTPAPGRRFGLLRVAFDQALAAIHAEIAPHHPDLRPAHLQLFRFGGIDGSHTAELAAHAGMTKQSMHELVTHLEGHGYLLRAPGAGGRAKLIRLTPAGRDLERDIHRAVAHVLEDWQHRLGPDRYDQLWATLADLTGRTEPPPTLSEIRAHRP